ncbi:MAG TPA: RHS repeat-associated core domain-containing protein [Luteibaculaceae bacterium]|nr:RHS repeat-associated core domain-containing protein [Luteibaculaceae bacterium]
MEAYVSYTPAAMIVRIYTGSMGIFYDGTNTKEILYIEGSTGLIGIQTKDQNQSPVFYYAYTDYLGSITELTNESGEVVFEQNFDAWGRRRNAFTWEYENLSTSAPFGWIRGYTGHEHLDEFGLINMNGRMYDPVLGLMLSPDNFVSDATSTVAYNRFLYANGNPLKYVDPDGEWVHLAVGAFIGGFVNWAMNGGQFNAKGLAYFGVGALAGALGAGTGAGFLGTSAAFTETNSFSSGAVIRASRGFTSGFGNSIIQGNQFKKALGDGVKAGAMGDLGCGLIGGLSGGIDAKIHDGKFWNGDGFTTNIKVSSSSGLDELLPGEVAPEYSNEYAEQFWVNHLPNRNGLGVLKADGSKPNNPNYKLIGDKVFFKGEEVGASTVYNIKSRSSDVFLYKSSFTTSRKLYLAMGHEYIHVQHNAANLFNTGYSENAAYTWSNKQSEWFGQWTGVKVVHESQYLQQKFFNSSYHSGKFFPPLKIWVH